MENFSEFVRNLMNKLGASLDRDLTLPETRFIIAELNRFLFTNYDGIGVTDALDESFEYLSEFHKFWEKHHVEILNPQLNEVKCDLAAEALHQVYINHNKTPYYELYPTGGLGPAEICRVRYFSANQDFRGSRDFKELATIYQSDPSIFDKQLIKDNPEDFLKNIGVTQLSQSDKRLRYAVTAAKLLIKNNIEPIDLLGFCSNDISALRNLILQNTGSGFGNKKTDIFLRDMVILGVWQNASNFDKIDVASDINTIKVALRSGILNTEILLLSSFLDIFCYQYALVDEMNARAWRTVWEKWKGKYPNECIESPCLIDYLVYRVIGKAFCREALCLFECETKQHTFYWHSARNKTCQVCYKNKIKKQATVLKKLLPCTHEEGHLVIEDSDFVSGKDAILPGITECPFVNVCNPRSTAFRKLNPPKSISIMGQTGWTSAYVRNDEGGGGLMA